MNLAGRRNICFFTVVDSHGVQYSAITQELKIEGYELFRKDRIKRIKTRGGGVLLYVKDGLSAIEMRSSVQGKCKALWVEIKGYKGTDITVSVCYRSPSVTTAENVILQDNINFLAQKELLLWEILIKMT